MSEFLGFLRQALLVVFFVFFIKPMETISMTSLWAMGLKYFSLMTKNIIMSHEKHVFNSTTGSTVDINILYNEVVLGIMGLRNYCHMTLLSNFSVSYAHNNHSHLFNIVRLRFRNKVFI